MVQYCSNCGAEIGETDKFCIKCGKSLVVGNYNNKPSIDSKSIKYGIVKFLLSFVLMILVVVITAIHPFFRVVPKDQFIALAMIFMVTGWVMVWIDKMKL